MYLIIVGAGTIATCLTAIALKNNHQVAIIEKNSERAEKILKQYDIKVFQADITQGGILKEAHADRADALFAITGDDSINLMTMILGKEWNIKNLVSILNESEHKPLFERLGVQVLSDPEMLIAQQLFKFIC